MFYVKINITEDACICAGIQDDNVFARRMDCGEEIPIDLNEMVVDGFLDLYGTGIRCGN